MRIELQLGSAGRRYLDLTRFRHPLQGRGAKRVEKIGQSTNMIHFRQQRPNLPEQGTNALGISTYVRRIGSQEANSSYRGSRLEIGVQLPTDSISSSSIFFLLLLLSVLSLTDVAWQLSSRGDSLTRRYKADYDLHVDFFSAASRLLTITTFLKVLHI